MAVTGESASAVIVGYGPTGQALALLLAKRGHQVTVVERWPDLYPLPRAVHFDHETARIFQAAGVIGDLNRVSQRVGTYQWRNADRDLLLDFDWTGHSISGWPTSNMFCQPELERVLDRHVKAEPSIELLQGWEAVGVEQDAETVTCTMARGEVRDGVWTATGERKAIRAPYLIGADGANSFVRRALNIPVNDLGFAFDWLVVDVVPAIDREWNPTNWQLCDPSRPTTIVSGGPGRRRWEFMLLPGEQARDMNQTEVAWSLLAPWDITPPNATLERHAVYTFRGQWATKWREGRALLAGDAAHLMPPFAGQGMCSGARDACALAWRLDLALRGVISEAALDSYGPERTAHVRAMIDFSVELGKVICITDPQIAAARDRDMLAARAQPGYREPQPLSPQLGPGLHIDGDAGAGILGPQGRIEVRGEVKLFDDVYGGRFALIAKRRSDFDWLTPQNRKALNALGAALVALEGFDAVRDVDGVYGAWLEQSNWTAMLTRPDFYVYGGARDADTLNAIVEHLRSALALSDADGQRNVADAGSFEREA